MGGVAVDDGIVGFGKRAQVNRRRRCEMGVSLTGAGRVARGLMRIASVGVKVSLPWCGGSLAVRFNLIAGDLCGVLALGLGKIPFRSLGDTR
jgi:hypothetical protein